MTITERDKKILAVAGVFAVLLGYWFAILGPKRGQASKAGEKLAAAELRRDTAEARLSQLSSARTSFTSDYAPVLSLGKAIPASVDMPSLLVQLDRAARGTGIDFKSIEAGERAGGAEAPPTGQATPAPEGQAAPEGQPASAPGKAADTAQQNVDQANAGGAQPAGAQSQPAGEAAPAPAGGAQPQGAPGLDSVPLEFSFTGNLSDLADFFHRLKRFVRVANDRVLVRGRLLTIDRFSFKSDPKEFPRLSAEVTATVYLAPESEGTTAGATPQGPQPAPDGSQPASTSPFESPQAATATP